MSIQPVNSVMRLILPSTVPLDVPKEIRGTIEELTNAILQLQNYVEQYCGVTQKSQNMWSQLKPENTLLVHELHRGYFIASENINPGAMINLYAAGSTPTIRNAHAADQSHFAVGFCSTAAGIPSGSYGEVILMRGINALISGVVAGTRYYLSDTFAGVIVTSPGAVAGHISQCVGIGVAPNVLLMDIQLAFGVF